MGCLYRRGLLREPGPRGVGLGRPRRSVEAPDADDATRVEAVARRKAFIARYRTALAKLREGVRDVVFPAGTYQLEVIAPGQPPIVSDPVQVRAGLDGIIEVTLPRTEGFASSVTVTAPALRPARLTPPHRRRQLRRLSPQSRGNLPQTLAQRRIPLQAPLQVPRRVP